MHGQQNIKNCSRSAVNLQNNPNGQSGAQVVSVPLFSQNFQLLAHHLQLHNDDLSVIVKKNSLDFPHSVKKNVLP